MSNSNYCTDKIRRICSRNCVSTTSRDAVWRTDGGQIVLSVPEVLRNLAVDMENAGFVLLLFIYIYILFIAVSTGNRKLFSFKFKFHNYVLRSCEVFKIFN